MSQPASTSAQFKIIRPQNFYTIEGVMLPSGAYGDVQVTVNPLNDGRSGTQSELAKTGWLGSAPLFTALLTTLYDKRDQEGVEELRKLFAEDFRRKVMTATRITYRTEAPDLITHDFGTPAAHTLEARLVGPGCYVNAEMGDVTQALFGSRDAGKVIAVYEWVTGRKPYLLRFDTRPKQDQECELVLGNESGSAFSISATDYILNRIRPARDIRVAPPN